MSKRTVTAVLAASALALLGIIPASADTRTDVRDLAAANLGKTTCSTNSLGGTGFMDSCRLQHFWCADFARWVWGNRDLKVDRLSPAAGSFYLYGEQNGTLHNDSSYVPQVGDAVVFNYYGAGRADHVALVDAVNSNGTIRTINGNFGGTSAMNGVVEGPRRHRAHRRHRRGEGRRPAGHLGRADGQRQGSRALRRLPGRGQQRRHRVREEGQPVRVLDDAAR
ncbi:CHAP domain-containing protein [Lentzea aerocolonigenes]|uniref:CHAP domain-containing protein n=1 Tax=Lentzea aerocolonigenes TaxID=68170 RepID=UPI0012DDE1E7|nr:CHAP domain-containing protein [Lentzea aerocolonigenes]